MKAFINSDYFKLCLDDLAGDLRIAIDKLQVSRLFINVRTTYRLRDQLVLQLTTLEEIRGLKEELKSKTSHLMEESKNLKEKDEDNFSRTGYVKQDWRELTLS